MLVYNILERIVAASHTKVATYVWKKDASGMPAGTGVSKSEWDTRVELWMIMRRAQVFNIFPCLPSVQDAPDDEEEGSAHDDEGFETVQYKYNTAAPQTKDFDPRAGTHVRHTQDVHEQEVQTKTTGRGVSTFGAPAPGFRHVYNVGDRVGDDWTSTRTKERERQLNSSTGDPARSTCGDDEPAEQQTEMEWEKVLEQRHGSAHKLSKEQYVYIEEMTEDEVSDMRSGLVALLAETRGSPRYIKAAKRVRTPMMLRNCLETFEAEGKVKPEVSRVLPAMVDKVCALHREGKKSTTSSLRDERESASKNGRDSEGYRGGCGELGGLLERSSIWYRLKGPG